MHKTHPSTDTVFDWSKQTKFALHYEQEKSVWSYRSQSLVRY